MPRRITREDAPPFRFTVGMGFSAMYGALLTKTNRIARIFQSATQSSRRPSYISPKSQLAITTVLVSVQFFGTLVWAVTAFPGAERVYPRREDVILKCNVDNSSFLISQGRKKDARGMFLRHPFSLQGYKLGHVPQTLVSALWASTFIQYVEED